MSSQGRVEWGVTVGRIALTLTLIWSAQAQAVTDASSTAELKKLSVEELMNIEITSVSKKDRARSPI